MHSSDKIAAAELAKIEDVGRRRLPEPKGDDGLAAVPNDGSVAGEANQSRRLVRDELFDTIFQADGGVQFDLDGSRWPFRLPAIRTAQPDVGVFDLVPVLDLLLKDAVVVAQPVADGGDLQRR